MKVTHQSELRFLGLYTTENLKPMLNYYGKSYAKFIYIYIYIYITKTFKETLEPIYDKKNLLFKFWVMYEVWHYVIEWG
jgi:hypothetical protein